jgi:hypothetical protein
VTGIATAVTLVPQVPTMEAIQNRKKMRLAAAGVVSVTSVPSIDVFTRTSRIDPRTEPHKPTPV